MEQNYKIKPVRYDYTSFELFLKYIGTVEPEIPYADKWAQSLLDKFNAISILRNEVLYQIPIWKREIEQVKETGYSRMVQRIVLLVKYETFLNSIYNFCENFSYLVKELYPKANLPTKFHDQKTKHLDNIKNFNSYYAEMLATADWYDEVHSMRSEATHFLSGSIFISDSESPGYLNYKRYNERKGHSKSNINKEDIEKHVVETYNKVYSFVMNASNIFIDQRCNKDEPIGELCLFGSLSGVRTMTLNDYLLKKSPKCEALDFVCPVEEICNASNKPSER